MGRKIQDPIFALVDVDGYRRVPHKISARDGRYGFAIHPPGKGNDASTATYTEDEKFMVQAVVLHGFGVRAKAIGGPQDGQSNTVGLAGTKIHGYWLCSTKITWVTDAKLRPINERDDEPVGVT